MTDKLRGICSIILNKKPRTTNLVLQKLLYFIQAASLIYLKHEAFDDEIQAWQYGPVVPEAYYKFKYNSDLFYIDLPVIEEEVEEIINIIIENLADRNAYDLVDLTHSYNSWKNAWNNGAGSIISKNAIIECHKKIAEQKNGFIF